MSAPSPGFWAAPVGCPECGRTHFTEGWNEAAISLGEDWWLPRLDLSSVVEKVERSRGVGGAERLLRSVLPDDVILAERRRAVRYPVSAPAVGVPLDEEGKPCAEAVDVTLVDLSLGGIGLMRQGGVPGALLVIDFSTTGMLQSQIVTQVCWRRMAHGVTKMGCRFLCNAADRPVVKPNH